MKKIISYSLFQMPNVERWLFYVYFRGLIFNVKANKLLYPDFVTHVQVDAKTFSEFNNVFFGLKDIYGCEITVNQPQSLCTSMLWRMKSVFDEGTEILLTRDSDAITTYREAVIIQRWLKNNNSAVFTIHDNPAHSLEIMGGLTSYDAATIRKIYGSWDEWIDKAGDLSQHGSDQFFLMDTIHKQLGATIFDAKEIPLHTTEKLEGVNQSLWTSNLCCFFIGSAGVNEMETLRWMRDNAKNDAFEQIERSYPNVFYQYQL